ncbi:MAG: PIN domain-containing protein [Nanoarchaeota archaeon]
MSYDYVLDSSVWVEYFKGSKKGKEIWAEIGHKSIATSIIAIAELADIFERKKLPFEENLMFIRENAHILPLSLGVVLASGKLKNNIRLEKSKFGLADAIHLATAQQENTIFVTCDHDFKGIENVMIF